MLTSAFSMIYTNIYATSLGQRTRTRALLAADIDMFRAYRYI